MRARNLAAGLVFLAVNALAQMTSIEGVVKGPDGKPIAGAGIHFIRTDVKQSYDAKTEKNGHYIRMGLQMGTYDIEVVMDGKAVDRKTKIRTRPGDPLVVNFDLRVAEQANTRTQAALQQAVATGEITDEMKRSMSKEQIAAMQKEIDDQAERKKKSKELNDAYNEGMTNLERKQYEPAIAAFQKAGALDSSQLAVWTHLADACLGNAEGKTGPEFDANMQKALEAQSKAIALKPDDAGLHNNYGLALAKARKFDDALVELKKAADLDPPNGGRAYFNLGALLWNANQPEKAADAFKKAIELTPTYSEAHYRYGMALLSQAKVEPSGKVVPAPGTVEAFQKYLELQPDGPNAQSAKDMLASLGSSIQTTFTDPNAKKKKK